MVREISDRKNRALKKETIWVNFLRLSKLQALLAVERQIERTQAKLARLQQELAGAA